MNDRDTNADTAGGIDPNRPWITDPRDAPANMNWIETLTNPSGVTSRVHFTRAWTGLFFLRLSYFVFTASAAAVFATAGASFSLPNWVWPLLVIVTAFLSLILHLRRLADAQRSAASSFVQPGVKAFGNHASTTPPFSANCDRVEVFPSNLIAALFSFGREEFFEVETATVRQVVDVSF